jgi:hypothetical protein
MKRFYKGLWYFGLAANGALMFVADTMPERCFAFLFAIAAAIMLGNEDRL